MSDAVSTADLQANMHSVIQRVATGPELSKDVSFEEARLATQGILEGVIDPVQAAIFFIALRMKRETADENSGVLQALAEATPRVTAAVDEVVNLVDPYNGYNRSLPPSPFLPPLLAACGVPTLSQGVETVGPKHGITHHRVLKALGLDPLESTETAASRLANPEIGWAYLDQSRFCPALYALLPLREQMVKRQVLTTVEVMLQPIIGRERTHVVTGFVHKPYPPKYADLARHLGYDSALLMKGVEGGINASLKTSSKHFHYQAGGPLEAWETEPGAAGIEQDLRIAGVPEALGVTDDKGVIHTMGPAIQATAEAGVAALEGARGPFYDGLVYTAAIILRHLGRCATLAEGADQARAALDSGAARRRLV